VPDDISAVLDRVPDYGEFFTLAELHARARALTAESPRGGAPGDRLGVGRGAGNRAAHGRSRTAPRAAGRRTASERAIGTLTIDLIRLLWQDDELRTRPDVTLFAIPVADPDGFVLNEGCFKGAFSPLRYALEFYRPPHREPPCSQGVPGF
jgi:hypothetical protein